MNNPQAEQLIRQELLKAGRRFIEKRRDFVTACFNAACPSLQDSGKMKLEISKDGTRAHCWVCDWKGSWDSFAKAHGMQGLRGKVSEFAREPYQNSTDVAAQVRAQLAAEEEESSEIGSIPQGMIPWAQYTQESWRGLTVEFLTSLGAQLWKQHNPKSGYTTSRIYLPFMQRGSLVGYTGRRLDSYSALKYYNAPWAKARQILYPYDYIARMKVKTVVLVEGQIDALNLIQYGIPALCIMGTNNWSDFKRDLLQAIFIDNVYVCMDGDAAGSLAASKLFEGTDSYSSLVTNAEGGQCFNKVENIVLPEGVDPGGLKQDQLAWLKGHIGL